LDITGLELPPSGVYAVRVRRLSRETDHPAVLNLGIRPTLSRTEGELRFEVHLLDFNADLYGEELEVTFVDRLRDERHFPHLEALKSQIGADISAARSVLDVR
jgi:riboflavin kinase / FMN adenylyltransferase